MGVCSEPLSPGRGREAAVSAATSERAEQLSNFACAAPLPRAAGLGAALSLRAQAPSPAGNRPRCGRVGGSWVGAAGVVQLQEEGGNWGCASNAPNLETTRVPVQRTPPACPTGWAGREEGGGGWRRSYGNCAGWLNKERAARRGSPAASISAADAAPWEARPTFHKFLLPPRSSLGAGEGGRRLERQAPAQEQAGRGDQPRGGGEGCKVRVKGECEGDPGLWGHRLFVPGPKNGARPWLEKLEELPSSRKMGSSSLDFQKRRGALSLGVRRKMGTWVSLGWYTLSPESCPHSSGVGLERWREM